MIDLKAAKEMRSIEILQEHGHRVTPQRVLTLAVIESSDCNFVADLRHLAISGRCLICE